ncbi:response regulator [Vibrio sp. 1-Bac 57]
MMNIKMNVLLANILQNEAFNKFTVVKLRDEYLRHSQETLCVNETRKYVYRQIVRLVKLDLLIKNGAKNSHKITYKKTVLFNEVTFLSNSSQEVLDEKPSPISNEKKLNESSIKMLEKTLKEYKVDMMSAIGESEEYIRLLDSVPEMKEQLREKYHLARDKSSKLLGKIKALQTIIAIQSETQCN